MSAPRVITDSLGGSALARAVQAGALDARVAVTAPAGVDAWRTRAREVAGSATRGWFAAMRDAFGASGPALERLERVAAAGGAVVTTGQQAGLFGGPIYTWAKAVGALAMADAIERQTGVPTAPVFWAATDDADHAEASYTYVIVDGRVERLVAAYEPAAGTPMALATLADVRPQLGRLRDACGSMAYERAYTAAAAAYSGQATVGGAYVALLRSLLEPLGVAVLDASHPAVCLAGTDVLHSALHRAGEVAAALDARHAWLAERGYAPQVADVAGLSTVFVHEGGRKRRVPMAETAPVGRSARPEALSPNVLLRPVMERAVLPTVAYLAGPGELSYFAQVSAVADVLGVAQPLAVPRWSCTIVDPAVGRAMARLDIGLDELRDADALESRLARSSVPEATRRALAELAEAVRMGLMALGAVDATDPDHAVWEMRSDGDTLRLKSVYGTDAAGMTWRFNPDITHATLLGRPVPALSSAVARRFLSYSWPGNVRELANCIERGVALGRGPELTLDDLPET
ncbi:MAG: hypothetical protein B7Z72_01620, partial [Gemmatimonadetes bacterium 21-71-4]